MPGNGSLLYLLYDDRSSGHVGHAALRGIGLRDEEDGGALLPAALTGQTAGIISCALHPHLVPVQGFGDFVELEQVYHADIAAAP